MLSVQHSRRSYRPAVEPLEGRMLLSAGDLDPTFGSGSFSEVPVAVLVQPEGKILVVGHSDHQPVAGQVSSGVSMARFNPDGSPDTGFGGGGQIAPSLSDPPAFAAALQPDGKIL